MLVICLTEVECELVVNRETICIYKAIFNVSKWLIRKIVLYTLIKSPNEELYETLTETWILDRISIILITPITLIAFVTNDSFCCAVTSTSFVMARLSLSVAIACYISQGNRHMFRSENYAQKEAPEVIFFLPKIGTRKSSCIF